ncbi:MAG: hemerythrin domain-containing protein [Bacteroidota bacterium]
MAPLKRHAALVPFSHEHRHILFLAQLLKKGSPKFQGYPTDLEGKVKYARSFFTQQLRPHIIKEEQVLFPRVTPLSPQIQELVQELKEEHLQMVSLFEAWMTALPDLDDLNQAGFLIERHVRKEERVLFSLIQQFSDEELLKEIEEMVSS